MNIKELAERLDEMEKRLQSLESPSEENDKDKLDEGDILVFRSAENPDLGIILTKDRQCCIVDFSLDDIYYTLQSERERLNSEFVSYLYATGQIGEVN